MNADKFSVWVEVQHMDPKFPQQILQKKTDLKNTGTDVLDVEVYAKRADPRIYVVYTFNTKKDYAISCENGMWQKAAEFFSQFDAEMFESQEKAAIPGGWLKVT